MHQQVDVSGHATDSTKRNPATSREDEIFHHLEGSDATKPRLEQAPDGVERIPSKEAIHRQVDGSGYATDSTKRDPSTSREDEIFHHLEGSGGSDATKQRLAQASDGVATSKSTPQDILQIRKRGSRPRPEMMKSSTI